MNSTLGANFVTEICEVDESVSGGFEARKGSELTKTFEGCGVFARACCCYDGSDQDKSGRFRPSADGFPPVRFPRPGFLHRIRSSPNDGQGEGNYRRHRVRACLNPRGSYSRLSFFKRRDLLRQDNPGQVFAKTLARQHHHPPGRTCTSHSSSD